MNVVNEQKCWAQVRKNSGVSLEQQYQDYESAMAPWPTPEEPPTVATCVGEDAEWCIEILSGALRSIRTARNVGKLQGHLIIANVNEFRLRDRPTEEEFEAILKDFERWDLRSANSFVGGNEARRRHRNKLFDVINAARSRFMELTLAGL